MRKPLVPVKDNTKEGELKGVSEQELSLPPLILLIYDVLRNLCRKQ